MECVYVARQQLKQSGNEDKRILLRKHSSSNMFCKLAVFSQTQQLHISTIGGSSSKVATSTLAKCSQTLNMHMFRCKPLWVCCDSEWPAHHIDYQCYYWFLCKQFSPLKLANRILEHPPTIYFHSFQPWLIFGARPTLAMLSSSHTIKLFRKGDYFSTTTITPPPPPFQVCTHVCVKVCTENLCSACEWPTPHLAHRCHRC